MTHLEETHNISHIIFESQVNHPIRLVHTEVFAVIERESFLLQHIDESSWCRYDDMQPLVERMALLAHRNTTNTQKAVKLGIFATFSELRAPGHHVFISLVGQFARWTEDDADWTFSLDEG